MSFVDPEQVNVTTEQTRYILAIDLGTSGPKVALVSVQGQVLDCVVEKTPLELFPGGGAEQAPEDWWNAIARGVKKLLAKTRIPPEQIIAVSNTTQWSGTVAVDRQGKPLMNAIIWMDSRGAKYLKKITGGMLNYDGYDLKKLFKWLRKTGGLPSQSGKDPIAHILFIKHELPQIYQNTYKFLEPKDYLNLKFTGKFAAGMDSIVLHWLTDNRDIQNLRYDRELIRMSTIDPDKLPPLKKSTDTLGRILPEIARELGLSEDTVVVMGTPDIQSATIGSGAVRDYEAHLYIGTSSWLTCHVPFKKTDILLNMASIPSALPNKYFVANEQECAGVCLTYLKDNLFARKDELNTNPKTRNVYEIFNQMAEKVPPGSNKVIFTPWLYGERTPVEDHTIRGGFHNLSLHTTRDHMIRAVFEGVALNSRWLLQSVEKFVKRPFPQITMIGGGAISDLWCQIHADILNRPIRQVKNPIETNVRGAAMLASLSLGLITVDQIAEQVPIANT
ncbi:MAG: FGGY-family carbohydrate kinase, partial [SAR324 cluster bacterium]|nr:FGGY-family carbohydrate kinase [SAR324 cluster bacterium]